MCPQVNTFQCVLATGGTKSFVIFLYDSIEWGTAGALGGVNAGDRMNRFLIPVSLTFDILTINSTSNVGIPGVWMFQVDTGTVLPPTGECLVVSYVFTCTNRQDSFYSF